MRAFAAISLLVLLIGSHTIHSAIKVHFDWNRSSIAELLCENKEVPQLNCNGQCVLMKRLNAEDNQDHPLQIEDNRVETEYIQDRLHRNFTFAFPDSDKVSIVNSSIAFGAIKEVPLPPPQCGVV